MIRVDRANVVVAAVCAALTLPLIHDGLEAAARSL
jgi:hypothetical protein